MNLYKCMGGSLAAVLSITLSAGLAFADTLVTMKGDAAQPGVVTAWSGSGKKVELSLKDGADANAVAAAIEANVERVRAKVRGGKVLVIGLEQDALLKALSTVELGGEGDMGLLAAAAMEDAVDSGSSLRAKKTADLKKLLQDRATVAQGQVVAVNTGKFPDAMISVRVLSGPTGELGKTVRKGQTVVFAPVFKMDKGQLNLADTQTQTNLGASFLQKGDRVKVKIGKPIKGGYEAELITR